MDFFVETQFCLLKGKNMTFVYTMYVRYSLSSLVQGIWYKIVDLALKTPHTCGSHFSLYMHIIMEYWFITEVGFCQLQFVSLAVQLKYSS